jgi:hypothetical protein
VTIIKRHNAENFVWPPPLLAARAVTSLPGYQVFSFGPVPTRSEGMIRNINVVKGLARPTGWGQGCGSSPWM